MELHYSVEQAIGRFQWLLERLLRTFRVRNSTRLQDSSSVMRRLSIATSLSGFCLRVAFCHQTVHGVTGARSRECGRPQQPPDSDARERLRQTSLDSGGARRSDRGRSWPRRMTRFGQFAVAVRHCDHTGRRECAHRAVGYDRDSAPRVGRSPTTIATRTDRLVGFFGVVGGTLGDAQGVG